MSVTIRFSGAKLRAFRLDKGLTQAELARRANVRERQIIRWENNQHTPRSGFVMALGQVLEQPFASFFDEGDGEDQSSEDDDEDDHLLALELLSVLRRIRPERSVT